jgi:hypothetical protein
MTDWLIYFDLLVYSLKGDFWYACVFELSLLISGLKMLLT